MNIDKKRFEIAKAAAGISVSELARRSGVSRSTIAHARDGFPCTMWTVRSIAEGLCVDEWDIVTDNWRYFYDSQKKSVTAKLAYGGGVPNA